MSTLKEPQTNWWPWLTFVWPSIQGRSVSLAQVWGRAEFEGNGARPSMTFAGGCRWAVVGVISLPVCDPGSSSLGCCPGVQHSTKPHQGCWWETGQQSWKVNISSSWRKGHEMYPSAFEVRKWKEFLRNKKKVCIFIFSPEVRPRQCQKIQVASWAWRRTVRGLSHCCAGAEPPWLCYFSLVLCTLQLSDDSCGRTWSELERMIICCL